MFTKSKITIAGDIFETYDFENEIWHGPMPQQKRLTRNNPVKSKNGTRTESSFFRAKGKVKRLINANVVQCDGGKFRPRFLTFTFRENIKEVKEANAMFTKFIRKFNYSLKLEKSHLQYISVIEFQERGAVHYHTLFFNLPFIPHMYDKIRELWGHGSVNSKKIDRVKNLGSYVCKYMTKNINDKRLYGQKCYFASMNLKKPRTIYNDSVVKFVAEFMPDKIKPYKKIIHRDHCGIIVYRRYDMKKHQATKKDLLAFIK